MSELAAEQVGTPERPLTWRDHARDEFATHAVAVRHSRLVRWWRTNVVWRVEGWLLAWTEDAEPSNDYHARYLAETEDGGWIVPAGMRNGEPWWQGSWRWWRPDHWPVYLRSRRANTYVMVESS